MECNWYMIAGIIVACLLIAIVAYSIYRIMRAFDVCAKVVSNAQTNDKQKEDARDSKIRQTLMWAAVAIFALWALSWCVIWLSFGYADINAGTFGDQFGAVNALFSGLAFAGLIVTLVLQREELEAQREELKQTREELRGQKQEFEIQNATLKHQQFSTTFFQLLNAVQNSIDNMTVIISGHEYKGYDCFSPVAGYVATVLINNNCKIQSCEDNPLSKRALFEAVYYRAYGSYFSNMGVFFCGFYRLIKFITMSDLTDNEKYQYTAFARAQLSDDMQLMLFYNCTIGKGKFKFKPLVEKWALLKNMNTKQIALPAIMLEWISDDAFFRNGRYGEEEERNKISV